MKIAYFSLIFLVSTFYASAETFAAGSCAIESSASKELTTYLSDLETTL